MEELEMTQAILKDAIAASDAHIRKMQELLIRSEERIDKSNEMVCQLTSVVAELKETFEHHIDQAVKSRDHVMKQNTTLLQRLNEKEDELQKEQKKYEALLQQLLDLCLHNKQAGTSVNITQ